MRPAAVVASVAAVVALLEVVFGLATGYYVFAYAWLHVPAVVAVSVGLLVTVWRSPSLQHPINAGLLGILMGLELPWTAQGVTASFAGAFAVVAALLAGAALLVGLIDDPAVPARRGPLGDGAPLGRRPVPESTPRRSAPAAVEPGWYSDPVDVGWLRWWDGAVWTHERHQQSS